MELTMNKILEEHLELVKSNGGTDAGVEMLELSMHPSNYYAANTYLVALQRIAALTTRLQEAEAIIKPFADVQIKLESGAGDVSVVPFGEHYRRAAAWLKGGN